MKKILYICTALIPFTLQAARHGEVEPLVVYPKQKPSVVKEEKIALQEEAPPAVAKEEIPAPSKPCTQCVSAPLWFASAEFLYWSVDESGMDFGLTKDFPVYSTTTGSGGDIGLLGKIHKAHFRWSPGVRAEIGKRFSRDLWELSLQYTYFRSTGSDTAKRKSGDDFEQRGFLSALAGTFLTNFDITPTGVHDFNNLIKKAESHIRLNYQTARLDLAKCFNVTNYILFRFFFGAEGAWISQQWRILYTSNSGEKCHVKRDWNFKGGGLNLGLDSSWCLGAGFRLLAKAGASAWYGPYHLHLSTKNSGNAEILNGIVEKASFKDLRSIYAIQMALGLGWDHAFERGSIGLYAAYERNTLFNLNETYRQMANADTTADKIRVHDTSNVNLQGLTAGLKLNY